MTDRSIPFDPSTPCDNCGTMGAFDFFGDYLCVKCSGGSSMTDLFVSYRYWNKYKKEYQFEQRVISNDLVSVIATYRDIEQICEQIRIFVSAYMMSGDNVALLYWRRMEEPE